MNANSPIWRKTDISVYSWNLLIKIREGRNRYLFRWLRGWIFLNKISYNFHWVLRFKMYLLVFGSYFVPQEINNAYFMPQLKYVISNEMMIIKIQSSLSTPHSISFVNRIWGLKFCLNKDKTMKTWIFV